MPLSASNAAERLPNSAVAAVVPDELIRHTCTVIRSWVDAWKDNASCRNFLRRRRFFEEIEESIVAVNEVISYLKLCTHSGGHPAGDEEAFVASNEHGVQITKNKRLTVYDLCSGKGFFAVLLSHLAPHIPVLAQSVASVVMVDKNSTSHNPISLAHVQAANEIPGCIPITFVQANLHDKQLPFRLGMQPSTRCIFVGIHLCQRLSSRCVHLYRGIAEVECMVLSPCCIPMTGETIKLQGLSILPSALAAADDPYKSWVDFLLSAMGGQDADSASMNEFSPPQVITAPLEGGPHRRNMYLVGMRVPVDNATHKMQQELRQGTQQEGILPELSSPVLRLPNPEVECTEFWYRGFCRRSPSCKFVHVKGSYLLGAHI